MDFTASEAAADVGTLAGDIAAAISTTERIAALEADAAPLDEKLWRALADAGLLGLGAAPGGSAETGDSTETGASAGAGEVFGPEETTAVATALGRHLARVPYAIHAVAALPALTAFGSTALRDEFAGPASVGDAVLSAALEEDGVVGSPATSTTLEAGRLTGVKVNVPYAAAAGALLVNAVGPESTVVVVRTDAPGVTITATPSTGLLPVYRVEFDAVSVAEDDVLSGGAATVDRVTALSRLAVAADQAGAVTAGLEATAAYAREREQFGRPIGSFQAVAQRLADGYIDAQALTLSTAQAAWLMSDAADASPAEIQAAVATAKFWADEAGHRVAHTAVHVHGGVGLDTSHPAHRYYLRAKQNEFTLGVAPVVLDELGELIASGAVQ